MDDEKTVIAKKSGAYVNQAATGYHISPNQSTPQPLPYQLSFCEGTEGACSPQTTDPIKYHVDRRYAMPSTISPTYYEGGWVKEEKGCANDLQNVLLPQLNCSESTRELENCVGSDLYNVITCLDSQSALDTASTSFHPAGTMHERSSLTYGVDLLPQGVLKPTNSEQLQQKTRLPTAQRFKIPPPIYSDSSSTPNMETPIHMARSWGVSTSGEWPPSQGDSFPRVPGYVQQQQQHGGMFQQHHMRSASTPRFPSEQVIESQSKVHDQPALHCGSDSAASDIWMAPQTSDVADELMPFLMERESRAIVLRNIGGVPSADLRSMCEAYGGIEYFEDGFKDIGKCVVFVAYYDLRSAVRANIGLQHDIVNFLDQTHDGGGVIYPHPDFMIPLYSVGLYENAVVYLQKLDPCDGSLSYISESEVVSLCQEFGTLNSVSPGPKGTMVEFFDDLEARAVVNAFVSDGPMHRAGGVIAVAALRSDSERKLGQQLLSLLNKWKVTADADAAHMFAAVGSPPATFNPRTATRTSRHFQTFGVNSFPLHDGLPSKALGLCDEHTIGSCFPGQLLERRHSLGCRKVSFHGFSATRKNSMSHIGCREETPLVHHPRRTRTHSESILHCMANVTAPCHSSLATRKTSMDGINCREETPLVHHPRLTRTHSESIVHCMANVTAPHHSSLEGKPRRLSTGTFCTKGGLSYESNGTSGSRSSHSHRFKRDTNTVAGEERGGCGEEIYEIDVEKIAAGRDKRTTVMIRNIPNKYTQVMLLSEIDVAFKQEYDFFYLPIDFKNRCNMGYAFINFLDSQSIISFWAEFIGQRWYNFNSEKVCAMSYARIQGRASMIARFQNSIVMDKGDEYRPVLFFTSGAEMGLREPFPPKDRKESRDAHKSNHSLRGSSNGASNPKGGHF